MYNIFIFKNVKIPKEFNKKTFLGNLILSVKGIDNENKQNNFKF